MKRQFELKTFYRVKLKRWSHSVFAFENKKDAYDFVTQLGIVDEDENEEQYIAEERIFVVKSENN